MGEVGALYSRGLRGSVTGERVNGRGFDEALR